MLAKTPAHPTSPQADPPLSRARDCGCPQRPDSAPNPVGASLLAKTPAHPTSPQADPPLSRARDYGCPQHPDSTPNPVGTSLLAKTPAHPTSMQADPPLSRAGSLPQEIAAAHSIRIQHQTLQQLLKHWRESAPSRCPRWPSCVVRCLRWCGSSLPGHRASRAGR